VQEGRAHGILEQAANLLLNVGFKRSRIDQELTLKSLNAAQDILAASERQAPSAIALARKGRSAVKRFFLGSTTAMVCQYAEKTAGLGCGEQITPAAPSTGSLDESQYAGRMISHVGEYFGKLPGTRVTLFHVMPAKPPGYWDDGHILDEKERSERQRIVVKWRAAYEEETGGFFPKGQIPADRRGSAREKHLYQESNSDRGYRP